MKKFLMMATVFAFTAVMSQSVGLTPAYADDQGGQPAAHGPRGGEDGKPNPEKFNEIKSKILKKMEERRAKLDKAEACVKSASDGDALRACMPKREGKHGDRDGKRGEWKRGGDNGEGGGGFMRRHQDGGDNGGGDE